MATTSAERMRSVAPPPPARCQSRDLRDIALAGYAEAASTDRNELPIPVIALQGYEGSETRLAGISRSRGPERVVATQHRHSSKSPRQKKAPATSCADAALPSNRQHALAGP